MFVACIASSMDRKHGEHFKQHYISFRLSLKAAWANIVCVRWPEKIRNEDLWKTANQEPMAAQIRRRKWGWTGHILRKPASNITRQALARNTQGKGGFVCWLVA